jgi:hypothetical protein
MQLSLREVPSLPVSGWRKLFGIFPTTELNTLRLDCLESDDTAAEDRNTSHGKFYRHHREAVVRDVDNGVDYNADNVFADDLRRRGLPQFYNER